ncbi:MAG: 1-deoxy-D-xylulose-5-phosphate synthase [Clostridia bacterium]|nr:1-deoxy-D-xylulose-5-phosphate synthase [Clostridia bacterium]
MLKDINSIQDLKKLSVDQLPELCSEIRQKLIDEVAVSGGHLASNLGVVELTVALHYVFDESDKIVWDVGHQSYVHKILTGRSENFSTLRQKDGISGFPDCAESATDTFNVGHAGTSLSAALGLAHARDIKGESGKIVAVVGDGSMTCGMIYEALNNVGQTKNLIIVLNDNNMSISDNVGSVRKNMSKLRVGKYDKNKEKFRKFLEAIPLVGKPLSRAMQNLIKRRKLSFSRVGYFDNFNLKYIGIIDGNNLKSLVYYLSKIKENVTRPTLLHIATRKGKGFDKAEQNPEKYHGVPRGGFDTPVQLGLVESKTVVSQTLAKLGQNNQELAFVCAAMSNAVGFEECKQLFPTRFFDVGIAEEHAVTFSAGLAKGGMHPFVGIYSTFLQRSFDQILHDVALQNLPVTFLLDRAGFVGDDGKTHQGLFDLSYLSAIPNLQIWTPSSAVQLQQMIEQASATNSPVALRYGRFLLEDNTLCSTKNWQVVKQNKGAKVVVLAVGANMLQNALALQRDDVEVVCVTSVKPLDETYLASLNSHQVVVTLEENVLQGGFGQAVATYSNKHQKFAVHTLGVDDMFVEHASIQQQIQQNKLDTQSLRALVEQILGE